METIQAMLGCYESIHTGRISKVAGGRIRIPAPRDAAPPPLLV